MTPLQSQIVEAAIAFNNYSKMYHTAHTTALLSPKTAPWVGDYLPEIWRPVMETKSLASARKKFITAAQYAGIDKDSIDNAVSYLKKNTRDSKQALDTREVKLSDKPDDTLYNRLSDIKAQIPEVQEASRLAQAQREAETLGQEQVRAAEEARQLMADNAQPFTATTEAVSQGNMIVLKSTSPKHEAARKEIAKIYQNKYQDYDSLPDKKRFLASVGLKEGDKLQLIDEAGNITDRKMLDKVARYWQDSQGLAADGKIATASYPLLLKESGAQSEMLAGSLLNFVTQKSNIGGKFLPYDLVNYTGKDIEKRQASNYLKGVKALLDKLGVKAATNSTAEPDSSEQLRERVGILQESQGLKRDFVIGKDIALSLALADIKLTAGDGATVDMAEIRAAVLTATGKPKSNVLAQNSPVK